ncbi:hypothetical protein T11_13776 [Trichinella zimbabwensis]|uniref:Uncharacterized protein n=1 Tax=Trichinella zimbabwensis TaxID=268475 RepID=A0A0V1HKT9_9BILA|nr:hypothetical protein T11_13776 [Trichinella zimbabwensis]
MLMTYGNIIESDLMKLNSHFNGSSTTRYELTIARLEELFIQYFSSKTARREKHKKENAFR